MKPSKIILQKLRISLLSPYFAGISNLSRKRPKKDFNLENKCKLGSQKPPSTLSFWCNYIT